LAEKSSPNEEERTSIVTNAVIAACVVGIVIVAALIVVTPRRKESFTQLWLKPWKLNLTNASGTDSTLQTIETFFNLSQANRSVSVVTVYGHPLYVFRRAQGAKPDIWFSDAGGGIRIARTGDTIHLGPNSFFFDDVDQEKGEVLLWEYPRTLDPTAGDQTIRFAVVIENDLGQAHEYSLTVSLSSDWENATKVVEKVSVKDGERKTCVVAFPLYKDEIDSIRRDEKAKVSARLDTGEEVHFWLGAS